MNKLREQLTAPGRDIRNPRVLKAMERVPREAFLADSQRELAYEDGPLPIGHGQTISQPFIVAFMTEDLDPQPGHRILEIGTGCGYQAAVLSRLVDSVYTVEIIEPLADQARRIVARLGYRNVHIKTGDGYHGWPEFAPYDGIIVTCAPEHIPQPLVDQLKEGGRMILPVGTLPHQELLLLEKTEGEIHRKAVLPVRFVPMTGLGVEEQGG